MSADRIRNAASSVWSSCGVSVRESATAFSFTCAADPDSGIAITLPLRMAQASATAVAEQLCAAPIRISLWSLTKLSPPSGEVRAVLNTIQSASPQKQPAYLACLAWFCCEALAWEGRISNGQDLLPIRRPQHRCAELS
jgi:hypothetical protein